MVILNYIYYRKGSKIKICAMEDNIFKQMPTETLHQRSRRHRLIIGLLTGMIVIYVGLSAKRYLEGESIGMIEILFFLVANMFMVSPIQEIKQIREELTQRGGN